LVARYTPPGGLTHVNEALCELFESTPQELIGLNAMELLPPTDAISLRNKIDLLSPDRPIFIFENILPLPNGRHRHFRWTNRGFFNASGQLIDCQVIGNDITELSDTRQELAHSQARAHAIVEHSSSLIVVCDDEGLICEANPAARAQLEMGVELVGCDLASFIDPDELQLYPLDFTALHTTQAELRLHLMCRPDGTTFPVEIRAKRMPDDLIMLVIHDTSEGQAMLGDIMDATARERRRIGLMLHDDLGQQLTGIKYLMDSLLRRIEREGDPDAVAPATHVRDLLGTAVASVRNIAHTLNPVKLSEGGLAQALQTLAEQTSNIYGIACTANIGPLPLDEPHVGEHLYWLAQEAVSNAVRHAEPTTIQITLRVNGPRALLEIKDDGCGMEVDAPHQGMGLRNLQHRAALLRGHLDIDSAPQRGTTVRCTFVPRGFNTRARRQLQ
jgi:two-component system sensor kinase FixL